MGESGGKEPKKTGAVEWVKAFMPIVSILVAGAFSVLVTSQINSKAQEREIVAQREIQQSRNDIAIVGMVVDVLENRSSHLYDWLPTLVDAIESKPLQDAMSAGVDVSENVPDSIKDETQVRVAISQLDADGKKPNLGQVTIVYFRVDARLAEKTESILTEEGYTCKLIIASKPPRMVIPEGFSLPVIIYPLGHKDNAKNIQKILNGRMGLSLGLMAAEDIGSFWPMTYEVNQDRLTDPSQLKGIIQAITPSTYPVVFISDWSK